MKKVIFPILGIIGAVILIVIFIGPTSKSPSSSSSNEPKKVGEETQVKKVEIITPSVFNISDKIDFDKRFLTVNSVQRDFTSSNNFIRPQEGKEFIVVKVTIDNNSNSLISFNEFDFKVENSQGVRRGGIYVGELKDQLKYGDLSPGGEITGSIPFEVSRDEKGLKLIYKPNFLMNEEVKILL